MRKRRPVVRPPRHLPVGQVRRNLEAVQRFRLNVVIGALLILFAGLMGRLAKLQLVDAAAYSMKSSRNHQTHYAFRGMRGRILDRHGRTLVTSRRVLHVAVDPAIVSDAADFARRLAVTMDAEDHYLRIQRAIVQAPAGCRHWSLYRNVEDERVVGQLSHFVGDFKATLKAGLKGLKVEEGERRTYVNGTYAAHVLGRAPRVEYGALKGGAGMESALNEALAGERLVVSVQRDGGRRARKRAFLAVDPSQTAGRDLRLTIDIVVQHAVETALDRLWADWDPESAAAVVLDPRTGEVLALASRPTFDPAVSPGSFNHAVQGMYPPGSLFKPFTAAYALGLGVVGIDERVELPPVKYFHLGRSRRRVKDSHPTGEFDGYGSLVRLLAYSSNTGSAELMWRVMAHGSPTGEHRVAAVRQLTVRMGLPNPTGIELTGELPAAYDESQGAWNPLFPALGFAFGQGFVMSPLRLASCFAAFARDDARIVRPTLLPGRGGPRRDLPRVCARPEHLAVIREGLRACAVEGTSSRALAGCPIPVAGKTGTAQVPGTPFNIAGFAGFAPADRPRVLVLVVAKVNEHHEHPRSKVHAFGGNVAGPAVRHVIEQTVPYLEGQEAGRAGEEPR